jgi:rhodanese-related sulfurtransferase
MRMARISLLLLGFLFVFSSAVMAQYPIISAEQVKSWTTGKKAYLLIDARTAEEYQQGHIPGAINIMPDHMKLEASRLPKDKKTPMIFYCRGVS